MSNKVIEFNTASMICGGTNIIETFVASESVRFNESYVIVGECLKAENIYAMYDLTVMGNVYAEKLSVNGKLYVAGNIIVDEIQCTDGIICGGKIQCRQICCDMDVIATMLDAEKVDIYGSLFVTSSVNVDVECKVERNVIVGEGFSGSGNLEANNVMAIDYIDFDGSMSARVFEMETMYKIINNEEGSGNDTRENKETTESLAEELMIFMERSIDELAEKEEKEIVENLQECAEIQKESFAEIAYLFNEIVRISYLDGIENLMDYLIVTHAKNVFPDKLIKYETIEHVFSEFLEDIKIEELKFSADSIYELMIALKIVEKYFSEDEDIIDSVFSFIGIRYKTVKKQFKGVIR